MRQMLSLLAVLTGTVLSVASSPVITDWTEQSDYPLTVGIGWDDYTTYDDLGELQMEQGFQGGQHFNASLRATGLGAVDGVGCTVWLVDPALPEDENVVVEPSFQTCDFETPEELYYETASELPDDLTVLPGFRLVVDDPDALLGRELELRVQIDGPGEQVGRAWSRGVVTWMPNPYEGDL